MRWFRFRMALCICSLAPSCLLAQTQDISLGEAARHAREQKKTPAKPSRVWTNDDLPAIVGAVSTVGTPAPAATTQEGETRGPDERPAAAGEEKDKERAEVEALLAEAKEQLKLAQKEVDLAQRDFDLQRQQYYSNPGYATDSAGKAKLDALSREVQAKQQQVQTVQKRVSALEEQLKSLQPNPEPKAKEPPAER